MGVIALSRSHCTVYLLETKLKKYHWQLQEDKPDKGTPGAMRLEDCHLTCSGN